MTYDRSKDPYWCPETYDGWHGLSDKQGKCPYCKRKYEAKAPEPRKPQVKSELQEAYDAFYNPDYGGHLD